MDLLRTDDIYLLNRTLKVAPFVAEHFKLARRPLLPRPVPERCSAFAAEMMQDLYTWIVKTDEGLLACGRRQ